MEKYRKGNTHYKYVEMQRSTGWAYLEGLGAIVKHFDSVIMGLCCYTEPAGSTSRTKEHKPLQLGLLFQCDQASLVKLILVTRPGKTCPSSLIIFITLSIHTYLLPSICCCCIIPKLRSRRFRCGGVHVNAACFVIVCMCVVVWACVWLCVCLCKVEQLDKWQ